MRLFRLITAVLMPAMTLSAITDEEFLRIRRFERQVTAHTVKAEVAGFDEGIPLGAQPQNGDEQSYADLHGSFNKGLQHQMTGYASRPAFESLVRALSTGLDVDFNTIQVGQGVFRMVNPQASLAFSLAGSDAWLRAIPPAPAFASAQAAGEMVEVYWTALARDVPFNQFSTDLTVASAITDLNTLTDFRGPKVAGMVTPGTFLRGNTPGDLNGPYISQFLYQTIPFGATTVSQDYRVPMAGMANDFVTTFPLWLQVITGGPAAGAIACDAMPHFVRSPRDLAEYVHQDSPGQAAFGALLLLNSYGAAALDPANPYINNPTQDGFVTFGISEFMTLLREAIQEGLKGAWFHKWQVNRRLRPEEYGFYVQQQVASGANLGISPQLINSAALPAIFSAYNSYFLPLAYPEGSPVHPSYPAGHAVLMGAAITMLKAFFNEQFVIPNPVEPNAANDALVPSMAMLTVGGELNKLAANISLARDHAGVHYRSDGFEGMNLGEQIAIDVLNNESFLFNENFQGFNLTKFDGTTITVGQKR
jgi:hypothetical protein